MTTQGARRITPVAVVPATRGPDWSRTSTSALTLSPILRGFLSSSAGSSAMRTGTRCTILIQLPLAFCGGSTAKGLPEPAPNPAILP